MKGPLIVVLSATGYDLAARVVGLAGGQIIAPKDRLGNSQIEVESIGQSVREGFLTGRTIIGVMASGSLIRILAPCLKDKQDEPPVLSIAEDGSSIVPLLGGHHGANDLARKIADGLKGHAAITTAGDLRFGIALDAPPEGWSLANPAKAKSAMAALLGGKTARLEGDARDLAQWFEGSNLPLERDGEISLLATTRQSSVRADEHDLIYVPRVHVLGMGCERGCDPDEAIELAERALALANISAASLAAITSIDVKADETALHAVARYFDVSFRLFSAARLEQETPGILTPSKIVFDEVGTHGVAENAALALAGKDATLVVPKQKSKRATAAIARSIVVLEREKIMETGRSPGRLFVVGIGPGQEEWRSPEVSAMIGEASDLVGYSLYLDLIEKIAQGKTRHDFALGKEEDRVRHAMELAGEGKDVALVCSGDAGIYAMATLVFELMEKGGLSEHAKRIGIAVSPGISALQAAAARAGAPLGHDFCTISLSDLLTPWNAIQKRLKAAAEGDFVIAFYNPVSKRRRTQLAHAKEMLLAHRPVDTPVILATDLGRDNEKVRIVPLRELKVDDVDMLTVVIVGSSQTRTVETGDGKTWVYTPRGYADKPGTGISS